MEMLEDKYLMTLGRNIALKFNINDEEKWLEIGAYSWMVANFVQGESDRDAREAANKAQWDESRDRIGKKVLFAASKAPSPHVIFGLERSPRGESRSILGNTMKDWVGLSDDEIMNIARESYMSRDGGDIKFARAIEAKLKEKNYA